MLTFDDPVIGISSHHILPLLQSGTVRQRRRFDITRVKARHPHQKPAARWRGLGLVRAALRRARRARLVSGQVGPAGTPLPFCSPSPRCYGSWLLDYDRRYLLRYTGLNYYPPLNAPRLCRSHRISPYIRRPLFLINAACFQSSTSIAQPSARRFHALRSVLTSGIIHTSHGSSFSAATGRSHHFGRCVTSQPRSCCVLDFASSSLHCLLR